MKELRRVHVSTYFDVKMTINTDCALDCIVDELQALIGNKDTTEELHQFILNLQSVLSEIVEEL